MSLDGGRRRWDECRGALGLGQHGRNALLPIAALALLAGGCSAGNAPPPIAVARSSALTEARALVGLDVVAARGYDGTGITVALIDSGVDKTHPDLAGKVVDEACFCPRVAGGCCPGNTAMATGAGSAADDNGHGTHIAGILASAGTQSPLGGAPGVQIVAVKVLSSTLAFDSPADIVAALDWVATMHPEVKVINLSLGTSLPNLYAGDCDVLYSAVAAAVDDLRANGVLVVAASGNDESSTTMAAPACIASVLSVGAVWDADVGPQSTYCTEVATAADQVGCFSNASTTLDLLAPGGPTESTWPGGGTQTHIGTSEAAPIASACAAALLQADPSLTPDGLEAVLQSTGASVTDARNGLVYPRIDCAAALAARIPLPAAEDAGSDPELDASSDPDAGDDPGPTPDAATPQDAAGSAGSASQAGSDAPAATDAAISLPDDASSASSMDASGSNPTADSGVSLPTSDAAEPDGSRHPLGGNGGQHDIVALSGGGCDCRASRPRSSPQAPIFVVGVLLAALARRRRRA